MADITTDKKYLTIGEVVNLLRPEFSDLSISKIRFLEDEGLIKPFRTSGGYRKFSQEDIDRLRFILKLQKEKYLPLNVIRQTLRNLDAGEVKSTNLFQPPEGPMPQEIPKRISVEHAPQATGLSPDEIHELETFDLIRPRESTEGKIYDATDIEIMHLSRELSQFGIQPRHLKMYQNFAEREAIFFEQILLPTLKQKNPEGRKKVTQALAELVKHSRQFKHLMLKSSLQNYFRNI